MNESELKMKLHQILGYGVMCYVLWDKLIWLKTKNIKKEVELSFVQYQQILLSLTSKPEINLATLVEGLSLLTPTLKVNYSTPSSPQSLRSITVLPPHPNP